MKKLAVIISAALFLPGCTHVISYDLFKQADKNISFDAIAHDPESYKGKLVILGGIIEQTITTKDGTLIEVKQKPLDAWGKPRRTDASGGLFVIEHGSNLDPAVYSQGREVTAAAEVEGTYNTAQGDLNERYPMVLSKELKLWPRERPRDYRPDYMDPLLHDADRPGNSMRPY